jgi:BarA-like signal transduction histidine kinase
MIQEKAAQIGINECIMKPIDRKKFADTVRKVLDKGKG